MYSPEQLDEGTLDALIANSAALSVDEGTSGQGHMVVMRRARRGYCFTVVGPHRVMLRMSLRTWRLESSGSRISNEVLVEEGLDEVPHAVAFARRLTRTVRGAVLDVQSGDVWPELPGDRLQRLRGRSV